MRHFTVSVCPSVRKQSITLPPVFILHSKCYWATAAAIRQQTHWLICVCVCVYLRQQNINHLNIRCHNICVSQEKIHAIDWQGAAVSHSDWWTCQPLAVKVKVGGARGSATLQLHDWSVVCGHRHLSLSSYINLQFLQVGVNVRGKSNQQPNLPRIKCRTDFKQIYRKSEKYKSS